MTDLDELKALAEAVAKRASERATMTPADEIMFDMGLDDITEAWDDAISPKTILALIERLEKAEGENAELKAALAPFSDEFRTNWSTYIPTYKSEILQLAIEDNVDVSLDAGGYAVEGLEDAVFTVEDLRTASRALGERDE